MGDPSKAPELPEVEPLSVDEPGAVDKVADKIRELLEKFDMDINFKLRHKAASASKCSMEGLGLQDGEVDIPAFFEIKTADNQGRPLDHGNEPIKVEIKDAEGNPVDAKLTDNGDGTYKVDYVPLNAGPHTIKVTRGDEDIAGSPATVEIAPPTPDPEQCSAEGAGLDNAVVGEPAKFDIIARNKAGMPLKVGGHPFTGELVGPRDSVVPCKIEDRGDGTYGAEYVPVVEGPSKINVKVADKDIKGSPFDVEVVKALGKADATKCYADGPGVEGGIDTHKPAPFTVHSCDPNGDKVPTGGDKFEASVTGPDGEKVPVELKDNGDGTYDGEYQPKGPGKHVVEVNLRRPVEDYVEPIAKSPYEVDVAAGVDPSKCIAEGPGVTSGKVEDTKPTNFKIIAKDCNGNPMNEGGQPFVVKVTDPEGKEVPANIKDNGDGTYDVDYAPDQSGPHVVEVSLDGEMIADAPFNVEVLEGADPENTCLGEIAFVVQSKARNGTPMTKGGEKVTVKIDPVDIEVPPEQEGEPLPPCEVEVTDNNDGTYRIKHSVPAKGTYLVTVYINGRKIKGCPFKEEFP